MQFVSDCDRATPVVVELASTALAVVLTRIKLEKGLRVGDDVTGVIGLHVVGPVEVAMIVGCSDGTVTGARPIAATVGSLLDATLNDVGTGEKLSEVGLAVATVLVSMVGVADGSRSVVEEHVGRLVGTVEALFVGALVSGSRVPVAVVLGAIDATFSALGIEVLGKLGINVVGATECSGCWDCSGFSVLGARERSMITLGTGVGITRVGNAVPESTALMRADGVVVTTQEGVCDAIGRTLRCTIGCAEDTVVDGDRDCDDTPLLGTTVACTVGLMLLEPTCEGAGTEGEKLLCELVVDRTELAEVGCKVGTFAPLLLEGIHCGAMIGSELTLGITMGVLCGAYDACRMVG